MSLLNTKTIVITTMAGRQPSRPVTITDMDDDEEPRKRRRLTHLSQEEKMLRRKLKNRVAAQTARDRKKALMSDLEIKIAKLEAENKKLKTENKILKTDSKTLITENSSLKERLGQVAPSSGALCGRVSESEPPRSAAPADPLPKEQIQALSHILMMHYAAFSLTLRYSDVLLGLLEQLNEESANIKPQKKATTSITLSINDAGAATPSRSVVGPSSAELESLNELIKFDHIYYKAEPNAKGGVKSSISSQTDSSVQQTTVHSGQIEIKEEESQPSVTVTDENSNMQVDVPTISIEDTTSLEDVTSLQLLEDIESLLQCEDLLDVADMDPASLIPQSETPIQNKCSQSRGRKRKHSSSVSSSSSPNSLTVEDHIQDYFSDSGVSGDLSDVPSPASDISSCLGDDSWEESFTELFPDLL